MGGHPLTETESKPLTIGHFLGGVGALIWDPATNKYLLLRRANHRDFQGGMWECLTGRVDQGESYTQALHREVREEIGAEAQIEFIIATTHFYRGEEKPDNELLGVIYGCTIQDPAKAKFGEEHSEQRWVTVEEAEEFLPEGHWLRNVLHRGEEMRALLPAKLRQEFRHYGFEDVREPGAEE
jgi:8-oxo-dGTP diphosphatase